MRFVAPLDLTTSVSGEVANARSAARHARTRSLEAVNENSGDSDTESEDSGFRPEFGVGSSRLGEDAVGACETVDSVEDVPQPTSKTELITRAKQPTNECKSRPPSHFPSLYGYATNSQVCHQTVSVFIPSESLQS